jgi:hypothetical protein
VLESFEFLDEAIEAYPHAQVVGNEMDTINKGYLMDETGEAYIPGSGLVQKGMTNFTSEIMDTMDVDSYNHTAIRLAQRYLASLAWSNGQTRYRNLPQSKEAGLEKQQILQVIQKRTGMWRFRSHTPQTIRRNYLRVMDLLTRGRRWRNLEMSGNSTEMVLEAPGLAFNEAGARHVVWGFPQLCLYDFRELEERVRFLLLPCRPSITSKFDHIQDQIARAQKDKPRIKRGPKEEALDCELSLFIDFPELQCLYGI